MEKQTQMEEMEARRAERFSEYVDLLGDTIISVMSIMNEMEFYEEPDVKRELRFRLHEAMLRVDYLKDRVDSLIREKGRGA